MLDEISWLQLMEWRYYASVEPFDETRMDRRFSEIQHMLINRWRNVRQYPNLIPIENTMMIFGDTPRPAQPQMSWQHMKMLVQQTAQGLNQDAAVRKRNEDNRSV
jgi:hypothetical protein